MTARLAELGPPMRLRCVSRHLPMFAWDDLPVATFWDLVERKIQGQRARAARLDLIDNRRRRKKRQIPMPNPLHRLVESEVVGTNMQRQYIRYFFRNDCFWNAGSGRPE